MHCSHSLSYVGRKPLTSGRTNAAQHASDGGPAKLPQQSAAWQGRIKPSTRSRNYETNGSKEQMGQRWRKYLQTRQKSKDIG